MVFLYVALVCKSTFSVPLRLPSASSYPENGVVQLSSSDVRARARTILKWHQLEVGQVVMVNYNPDEPKERGFWYDAEIQQKKETKMVKELNAKIILG